MRIDYLKVKNFAGIYAGLGRTEIELDFRKSKNKIVGLLGGNGSGKTTLLSLLHPYRETLDSRKDYILVDKKGYKEIHLTHKKNVYKIIHSYGSTSSHNKSFISKNGEELNENGGIKTFDKILLDEFNLTKDYFKIGRLGSNVTTFIDLKAAERKKFMNNFLPDIDDYLEAFEVVNEKFKVLNNTIKTIRMQLDKLDDKDNLQQLEETLTNSITTTENSIKGLTNIISKSEGTIESLTDRLNIEGFNDYRQYMIHIKRKLDAGKTKLQQAEEILTILFAKHKNLDTYDNEKIINTIKECENAIILFAQNIENIDSTLDNIEKDIVRLHNEKASKENIIKEEVNVDFIQDQIKSKKLVIDNYQTMINESKYKDVILNIREVNVEQNNINKIVDLIQGVKAKYTQDVIDKADVNRLSKEVELLEEMTKGIVKSKNKLTEIKDSITRIESNEYLLETLDKRPSDCVIDTCPFIVKALTYKNTEHSKLVGLYKEKDELESAIPLGEKTIELTKNIIDFIRDVKNLTNIIDVKFVRDYITKSITEEYVHELIKDDISKVQALFNIDDLVRVVNNKAELLRELDKLKSLEEHLQLALKQKAIVDQAKKELEQINIDIQEKRESKEQYTEERLKAVKQNKTTHAKLDILKSLKGAKDAIDSSKDELLQLETEYQNKLDIVNSISEEEGKITQSNNLITLYNKELAPLKDKLKKVQRDLIIIEDCSSRLKVVEQNFDDYKHVRDALDPKKGIPLFFIDNYLKDIAVRANNLLGVAYGDQFKIKFDINASDFFVNVFKADGTFLKDIGEASQGETSLTTISLSLGMLERLMNDNTSIFNILYLDEIDSTLSVKNRRLFIALLDSQMEELDIEQVFLISHNNEFDSYPVDLILLNEHTVDTENEEFMQNKNIIFDINK